MAWARLALVEPHDPPSIHTLPTWEPGLARETGAGSDMAGGERDLVERARSDPEAFAELYRLYVDRIYAFCYRRSHSREVAEDMTAATFESALGGIAKFSWRDGGVGAWLYRIASNKLADYYRHEGRSSSERGQRAIGSLAGGSSISQPTDEIGRDDDISMMLSALGSLNARYQRVITLRYLGGLDPEEAAAAMGCSKPTLAVTLHRAMGALRKQMELAGATPRGVR